MKKIIFTIIIASLLSGCTGDKIGDASLIVDSEKGEVYSVEQIKAEKLKPNYGSKRSEIMSKVFIPKDLKTGKREFEMNGWNIVIHEKSVVKKGNSDVLKIVVSGTASANLFRDGEYESTGIIEIDFAPFWYVNPPVSNKECTDPDNDPMTDNDECVYDYETESVLKQILWDSMVAHSPEIK